MTEDIQYSAKKYYEGWTYHKPSSGKSKETKYWMVLRGDKLFLFNSNKTVRENLEGMLRLTHKTQLTFKNKTCNFKLVTISAEGKKQENSFKFENQNDRDLWRSFIIGLTTGRVPTDVKLLPGQLTILTEALSDYQSSPIPTAPESITKSTKSSHADSARHASFETGLSDGDNWSVVDAEGPEVNTIQTLRIRQSDLLTKQLGDDEINTLSGHTPQGGRYEAEPNISLQSTLKRDTESNRARSTVTSANQQTTYQQDNHMFFSDSERNKLVPAWFFDECTRDEAEEILTVGRRHGNILMRLSTHFATSGNYVISFRQEDSGVTKLHHYAVIRQGRHFKLDVKNQHKPMGSLSEVIEFFASFVGPTARPISTNDKSKLFRQSQGSSSDSGSQISYHSQISGSALQPRNSISSQRSSFAKPVPYSKSSYTRSESFESAIMENQVQSSSPHSSLTYSADQAFEEEDNGSDHSADYLKSRRESETASEFSVSVSTMKERLTRQLSTESSLPDRSSILSSSNTQRRTSGFSEASVGQFNGGRMFGNGTIPQPVAQELRPNNQMESGLRRVALGSVTPDQSQKQEVGSMYGGRVDNDRNSSFSDTRSVQSSIYNPRSVAASEINSTPGYNDDQEVYGNASEIDYPVDRNDEGDSTIIVDGIQVNSVAAIRQRLFLEDKTSRTSTLSMKPELKKIADKGNGRVTSQVNSQDELLEKLNRRREDIYAQTTGLTKDYD